MANRKADADATGDWIVRFTRRKDGRKYYFRYDCALTGREESSKRMPEDVAKGLALAITRQHPDFTARALKYRPPKQPKAKARQAARMPQTGNTAGKGTEKAEKEVERVDCK